MTGERESVHGRRLPPALVFRGSPFEKAPGSDTIRLSLIYVTCKRLINFAKQRSIPRMKLKTIGDEMSELNIQRRFRYIADNRPRSGFLHLNEEWVKDDPALQMAVRLLPWVTVRKPRV